MWCAKCQSEVAVEARPNSQRLHCATCGTEITARLNPPQHPPSSSISPSAGGPPQVPRNASPGRNPQELLARWAGNQMFDPYAPIVPPGSTPPAENVEVPKPASQQTPPNTRPPETRLPDSIVSPPQGRPTPRDSNPPPPAAPHTPVPGSPVSRVPEARQSSRAPAENLDKLAKVRIDPAFTEGWGEIPTPHVSPPSHRVHAPHARIPQRENHDNQSGYRADSASGLRGPHFDPARMIPAPPKSFKLTAILGQVLAHLGAATLTAGAGMVLWGYLGGPTHYAPTGWFTTTVGQMLLFLGVVTLVSAGMEQTTVEVSKRIDSIGNQLNRLESAAHANSVAANVDLEATLRAEIAELRQQLSERG